MANPLNMYKNASVERKAILNEHTKKWRKANKDKVKATRSKSDAKRKVARKERILKTKYGLTYLDFCNMLENQNYVCAICYKVETALDRAGSPRTLVVDHCHTTGKIRGLLCNSCNVGLGHFDDNIEYMANAISYLEKSK
jgi:hypothetical protein